MARHRERVQLRRKLVNGRCKKSVKLDAKTLLEKPNDIDVSAIPGPVVNQTGIQAQKVSVHADKRNAYFARGLPPAFADAGDAFGRANAVGVE
jgi:hypothetical protein